MSGLDWLSRTEAEAVLDGIRKLRVVLLGDLCLDVYWTADMRNSELSLETPHFPLPVVEERHSPGGGGNVAMNLRALNTAELRVVGIIGEDWRGRLLEEDFTAAGIDHSGVLKLKNWTTRAYCKPIRTGNGETAQEDPRLDFAPLRAMAPAEEEMLLERLAQAASGADLLCVADQFANGALTPRVRQAVNALAAQGLIVVADSRCHIKDYRGCWLKPNRDECMAAAELEDEPVETAARVLSERTGSKVCVTLSGEGCYCRESGGAGYAQCAQSVGPIDPVGAGDSFLAAFACSVAAGSGSQADIRNAMQIGQLASGVTVRKCGQTGTAAPEEILAMLAEQKKGGSR